MCTRNPTTSNHGIYTWYDSLRHNIGFHQDKTRDIEDNSLIIVLKMGHASRTFSFREKRTEETKEPEPFWSQKLEPQNSSRNGYEGLGS